MTLEWTLEKKKEIELIQSMDLYRSYRDRYGLTENEATAIAYYTLDAKDATSKKLYATLNRTLASRKKYSGWVPYLYFLLSGLQKLPDYKGVVYRAVNIQLTGSSLYQEGNDIVWVALTSTSAGKEQLENFSGGGTGAWVVIDAIEGKDVSPFSRYPKEAEVLLLPNANFKIDQIMNENIKKLFSKSGYDVISLRQCETPKKDLPYPPVSIIENNKPNPPVLDPSKYTQPVVSIDPFNATQNGNLNDLKEWFKSNKSINITNPIYSDCTLLYTAVRANYLEIVKWLLQHNADVNLGQTSGTRSTPLHTAAFNGNIDICKILLEQESIKVNIKNRNGETPLDNAKQSSRNPNVPKKKFC
jgi:hypothetical protein